MNTQRNNTGPWTCLFGIAIAGTSLFSTISPATAQISPVNNTDSQVVARSDNPRQFIVLPPKEGTVVRLDVTREEGLDETCEELLATRDQIHEGHRIEREIWKLLEADHSLFESFELLSTQITTLLDVAKDRYIELSSLHGARLRVEFIHSLEQNTQRLRADNPGLRFQSAFQQTLRLSTPFTEFLGEPGYFNSLPTVLSLSVNGQSLDYENRTVEFLNPPERLIAEIDISVAGICVPNANDTLSASVPVFNLWWQAEQHEGSTKFLAQAP